MKNLNIRATVILVFCFALLQTAAWAQKEYTTETLEIYTVVGDEENKKPTVLNYKEIKYFDTNSMLIQQDFYSVDNKLKGYEIIKRDGAKGVSNYFSTNAELLAIYNLDYEQNLITKRVGYDGSTKELLRSELFEYDDQQNLVKKTLLNNVGKVVRIFDVTYDGDGNEIGFSSYNSDKSNTVNESYIITEKDYKNRWTEKWGYKGTQPKNFYRRTFK